MTAPAPTLDEQIAAVEFVLNGGGAMDNIFPPLRAAAATLRELRDKLATPASTETPEHDHRFHEHISRQLLNMSVRCGTCGAIVSAERRAEGTDQSAATGAAMRSNWNDDNASGTPQSAQAGGEPDPLVLSSAADPTRAALVAEIDTQLLVSRDWAVLSGIRAHQALIEDLRAMLQRALAQIVADGERIADPLGALGDLHRRIYTLERALRELRAWDMLDTAADGAYFKRRIDEALEGNK